MATSNLPNVLLGIAATLAEATGVGNVILKLPDAPSNAPLLYIVKPRWKRIWPTYGEQAIEWTYEATLALPTENNELVESDLLAVIVSMIEVAGHDLDAGETLPDGEFLIVGGRSDYGTINGIPVLAHQFEIVIHERVLYTHSL
jgi:hypothetical protein